MDPPKRKKDRFDLASSDGNMGATTRGEYSNDHEVTDIGTVSRIGTGSKQGVTARPLTNLGFQQVELQG
jgi:hypothetical protein